MYHAVYWYILTRQMLTLNYQSSKNKKRRIKNIRRFTFNIIAPFAYFLSQALGQV